MSCSFPIFRNKFENLVHGANWRKIVHKTQLIPKFPRKFHPSYLQKYVSFFALHSLHFTFIIFISNLHPHFSDSSFTEMVYPRPQHKWWHSLIVVVFTCVFRRKFSVYLWPHFRPFVPGRSPLLSGRQKSLDLPKYTMSVASSFLLFPPCFWFLITSSFLPFPASTRLTCNAFLYDWKIVVAMSLNSIGK